jgi:hypothetical protein
MIKYELLIIFDTFSHRKTAQSDRLFLWGNIYTAVLEEWQKGL